MLTRSIQEEWRLRNCLCCGDKGKIVYYEPANGYYAACENEKCYIHTEVCGSALGAADDWNSGAVVNTWYRKY